MTRFPHEWVLQVWTGNPLTIVHTWATTSNEPRWRCKLCGLLAISKCPDTECPVKKTLSEVMES